MMKHVKGWKLSKFTGKDHNVYVRSFSEAKSKCMKDYGKPCICEKNSDNLILHVGTNELNSELPLREWQNQLSMLLRCSIRQPNS